MNESVLLLGSNMGDRLAEIKHAENEISKSAGDVIKSSKVYETASWGDESLAPFLNKVILIKTKLTPVYLLETLLHIEKEMGRSRTNKWESRKIDIDILFYNDELIQLPQLIIPHPYLHERKFTLVPLVEILPEMIHPLFKKTSKELLVQLTDTLSVYEYKQ